MAAAGASQSQLGSAAVCVPRASVVAGFPFVALLPRSTWRAVEIKALSRISNAVVEVLCLCCLCGTLHALVPLRTGVLLWFK